MSTVYSLTHHLEDNQCLTDVEPGPDVRYPGYPGDELALSLVGFHLFVKE